MRFALLGFFLLGMNAVAFGQQGTLTGKVTDKKTAEGIIGATVLVTGTTQAAPVNVDGSYALPLDAGTYDITMTYVGYKPLTFPGVVIKSGETTPLNGTMEESTTSLTEVTVTGVKQTGTEVAMIQDLKKSEVVVSGMSSDQIVKTLDRDAAEVVKRIPGVTIQNNNFIVIRGLAERYNTVMLNDALTPSAEVDTRSFSFDILPSSVIDRILIFKSGAPELPGEFGGGVVKVYTRNSVLDNSSSISVSGWGRSNTVFKNGYQATSQSATDWLGFDNGRRKLPDAAGAPVTSGELTPQRLEQLSGQLPNQWTPRLTMAAPDLRVSLGLNRKFEIGKAYISNVTSLSYANTREQTNITRQRYLFYDPSTQLTTQQYNYNDQRSVTAARLGVIHNWQVRLNDDNRFEFRNFLNQYGTDEVIHRTGVLFDQDFDRDGYALHYQSRSIYSGQLQGSHNAGPARNQTVTWAGGYNYVFADEPDYRRTYAQRDRGTQDAFVVQTPSGGNPFQASRYYSKLKENTYMGSGQYELRFTGRDSTRANQYKLRAGFYLEHKNRTYDSRYFSYVRANEAKFNPALKYRPFDEIFAPQNLNVVTGFAIDEGTKGEDRYEASNDLRAGYVSFVAPISDQFSVSGGLRVENNRKYLKSGDPAVKPYEEITTLFLPSLNATYNFNERSLLRAGTSITVNRPEFREVANYSYFDFATNAIIKGSDSLRTARIYNADLRYEFYPTRSELLSVGVFYKNFRNAIEQTTLSVPSEQTYLGYQNATSAYDLGVELEARKSLVGLVDNPFWQHFSLVLNASLIKSRVRLADNGSNQGLALTDRPLQGQAPYVVNAGIFYQDDEHKWQVTAQYNVVGQRLSFVGDKSLNFSVFEMPRNTIDLSLTKGIGEHLEVKAGIQDLLNQQTRLLYDFNRDGKISGSEDGAFARYRRGSYSMLGLTYKF